VVLRSIILKSKWACGLTDAKICWRTSWKVSIRTNKFWCGKSAISCAPLSSIAKVIGSTRWILTATLI
jgi:hypothetical protein